MHFLMITVLTLSAIASAEPSPAIYYSGGLLSSPLTSAALVAPPASVLASSVAPIAPVAPVAPVAPAVAPVGPVALSDYRFGYGSSYSYQDVQSYPVVNSALSLPYTSLPYTNLPYTSLPYTNLPYAYAADYYYRK